MRIYTDFVAKRIASEVCLIDKDSPMAEAEAEDIRQAGIFLGNPLVTGTSGDSRFFLSSRLVTSSLTVFQ